MNDNLLRILGAMRLLDQAWNVVAGVRGDSDRALFNIGVQYNNKTSEAWDILKELYEEVAGEPYYSDYKQVNGFAVTTEGDVYVGTTN